MKKVLWRYKSQRRHATSERWLSARRVNFTWHILPHQCKISHPQCVDVCKIYDAWNTHINKKLNLMRLRPFLMRPNNDFNLLVCNNCVLTAGRSVIEESVNINLSMTILPKSEFDFFNFMFLLSIIKLNIGYSCRRGK